MSNRFNQWIVAIAALFVSFGAQAQLEEADPSPFNLGVALGQVGLAGDPGSKGANALGYSFILGYELESGVMIDARLLTSRHADTTHTEITLGGEYGFDIEDLALWTPYLSGGVAYITNNFNEANVSGNAAGIYVGTGVDYSPNLQFSIGPEFRYVKGFEAKAQPQGTASEIKTVQDSYTFMIRILYALSLDE